MSPLEGLQNYLDRLEKRLKFMTWTRGAAAIAGSALALTLLIVGILTWANFTPSTLLAGRFALFVGIGAAAALALIVPLTRLNRRRAAQEVERRAPGFDQRLLTFTEKVKQNASDPFLPLLAEDTLDMARDAQPEQIIESSRMFQFGGAAAVAAAVLLYLMFAGPGMLGTGTQLLWGSFPKDAAKPMYSITVEPGSKTIRRKTDQLVSAQLTGFTASKAVLKAKYASGSKWEEVPMDPQKGGSGFSFLFVGLGEDVEYSVDAGGL